MRSRAALLVLASCCLVSCQQDIPKDALALTEVSFQRRQMQTRRFDTGDEAMVLSACAALLQDLGFNLDESESELGLIVSSKERDATETGQVITSFIASALSGYPMPYEEHQRMRACVVTRPVAGGIAVRVTFQRIVWNSQDQVSRVEGLYDPEDFQEFFSKLSKSLFLEAEQI